MRWLVFLLIVGGAACNSDPPARTPSGAKASCFSDFDCVVTDFSCCACCKSEPHAIPKAELDKQQAACAAKSCEMCSDKIKCPEIQTRMLVAKCKDGTCAAQ